MRVWAALVGSVVTFAFIGALSSPADAVGSPPPGTVAGTPLPQRAATPMEHSGNVLSASDTYVAVNDYQPEEGGDPQLMIHRISDGKLIRTITYGDDDSQLDPRLSGQSIVQLSENSNGFLDTLTTTDVVTGTQEVLHFPAGNVVGFGAGWVLSCNAVNSSDDCRIRLTNAGVTGQLVGLAVNYSAKISSVDGGASRAVVTTPAGDQWAINTVSGAIAKLAYPQAIAVAGGRAYWIEEVNDAGTMETVLHWMKQDGTGAGSVVVQAPTYETSFVAFGARVALLRVPDDGDSEHRELRPVNLTTGALEPAVAHSIGTLRALSNGSEILALGDTPTGRIAAVKDNGAAPLTVFALAPIGMIVDRLKFSSGHLASTWEGPPVDQTVYFTDTAPTSHWSTTGPAGLVAPPVSYRSDGFFGFSNHTILTDISGSSTSSLGSYRLTGSSGGSRDLTSWFGPPILGHGGTLIGRYDSANGLGYVKSITIQDASSGSTKATLTGDPVFAIDRSWVWSVSSGGSMIHGRDTDTTQTRDVPFTPACASAMDVIGTWALVECDSTGSEYAVDLTGNATPWKLPMLPGDRVATLGGSFVAWAHYYGSDENQVPVIEVASLAGTHEVRTFGPARGLSFPPGPTLASDDSGAAELAYVDSHYQPRLLDLRWTDTTAPKLSASAVSPAILASPEAKAKFTFAGADNTPNVRFDVAYRTYTAAQGYGSWVSPPEWTGIATTNVTHAFSAGTTMCFRARVVDQSGNLSSWGSSQCSISPLDDRSLSASRHVSRGSNASAMLKSESVLHAKGASLTKRDQRFHEIYLLAWRGPHEGSVKVYAGKTLLHTVSLKSSHSGYERFAVNSSKAWHADIRLVSASSKRARIDGIALRP